MNRSGSWRLAGATSCILLAASLTACSGTPPPAVGMVPDSPVPGYGQQDYSATEPTTYTLNPNDVVSVNVFREPDLSVEKVPVGADGVISLPLIGPVKAEGLTASELADVVTRKLGKGYLKHPKVSVNVLDYASHVVTVEGGVEKPGVYPFVPGARLSSAIARASGPARTAKTSEVAVFRRTPKGMTVAKFDYGAISAGTMMDPVLKPGDRVVVGVSGLSQFWQDLIKALPAFALFTRI